jgi:molybdate/tungstate transport system substrate-binding protein
MLRHCQHLSLLRTLCTFALLAPGIASAADEAKTKLIVFHAGSLSVPMREVSKRFMEQHPNVEVLAEAAGSRDCARKVSDLGRPCDILAAADYKVVENLLMPDFADFNIRFATNEMAVAYTERSNGREELTAENWPEVLLRKRVAFGRADPNRDPCGYRSVMVFQLAERYLKRPGLAKALELKDGRRFIRPKETDLLALLESGEIDYLFIYRSVAQQHNLKFLTLPDQINLKAAEHADLYDKATVQVTGKKPGEFLTRRGAPIQYSATIPQGAPNRQLAEAYLAYLLSPEGQAILSRNGQTPILPARAKGLEKVPKSARAYCATSPSKTERKAKPENQK